MAVLANDSGVTTPGSATDNAVARWNGTDGSALQDSGVIVDDSDNVTGIAAATMDEMKLSDGEYTVTFSASLSSDRTVTVGNVSGSLVTTATTATLINKTLGSGTELGADLDAAGYNIDDAGDINGRAGVVAVSGTSKTLALTDANTIQECSNGSGQAITIDTNTNVAFPLKTWLTFEQHGAGTVSITGASGVSINGNTEAGGGESTVSISAQWGAVTIRKIGTNAFIAYGSL
jgi:hypothetical protein